MNIRFEKFELLFLLSNEKLFVGGGLSNAPVTPFRPLKHMVDLEFSRLEVRKIFQQRERTILVPINLHGHMK